MTPGFIKISAEEYHRDPCPVPSLSSSIANLLLTRSPLHAWYAHPRLNPDFKPDEDEKFDIGTAAHSVLLQGINNIGECPYDSWRTTASKLERDAFRKAGKIPLLTEQAKRVRDMVAAAKAQLLDFYLGTQGDAEQTIVWQEGDVWLRVRLDWIDRERIDLADYKTTETAEPISFSRRLFSMGYDVQEAFYRRVVRAVLGQDKDPRFVFIVQETQPPYLLSLVALDKEAQDLADRKVERAIDIWRRCMQTNKWPGYPQEICYAQAPGWAASQWEEAEAVREIRTDLGDVP